VYLNVYPLVRTEERAAWEAYTANHNAWVNESIAVQAGNENYKGPIIWEYENWDVIYGSDEYFKENPGESGTNRTGPYLPIWQASPVIPRYPAYNW